MQRLNPNMKSELNALSERDLIPKYQSNSGTLLSLSDDILQVTPRYVTLCYVTSRYVTLHQVTHEHNEREEALISL